jgi:hypothetical protein
MNAVTSDNDLIFIVVFLAIVTLIKTLVAHYWARNYKEIDDRIGGRHALLKRVDDTSHLIDWSGKLNSDFIGFVRAIVNNSKILSGLNAESQALLLEISVQVDPLPSEGQISDWSPVALINDLKRVEELKKKYLLRLQSVAEELMKNASSHVNASQIK